MSAWVYRPCCDSEDGDQHEPACAQPVELDPVPIAIARAAEPELAEVVDGDTWVTGYATLMGDAARRAIMDEWEAHHGSPTATGGPMFTRNESGNGMLCKCGWSGLSLTAHLLSTLRMAVIGGGGE